MYALSTSVVVPCMTTLVSHYGTVSQKGIVMGVYRSLGALGRAMGPCFSCVLYWMTGPEICYSIGGLGLIIPYLMLKSCKTIWIFLKEVFFIYRYFLWLLLQNTLILLLWCEQKDIFWDFSQSFYTIDTNIPSHLWSGIRGPNKYVYLKKITGYFK